MRAIILAAGRGSRMKEQTDFLPKCLIVLRGKTLLERQIDAITQAGINEIAIVTGYKAEEIRKRFPQFTYFHNEAWETTNMVATLLKAKEWLQVSDCIVSYSDIVYTSKAIELLQCTTDDIAIPYYTDFLQLWKKRFANPLEDLETFKLDEDSRLVEIGHRAGSFSEIEGQYMGLLKITPAGFHVMNQQLHRSDLPKTAEKMDMTGLLLCLVKDSIAIHAVPYSDLWLEVDTQTDLDVYENSGFLEGDLA